MSDRMVRAAADRPPAFRVSKLCARAARAAALLLAAVVLQACGGGGGDDPPAPPPPPAAPTALSYSTPQSYTVGTAIAALSPTVTGTVASYGVAPALPAGIALDTTTGVISGTPTAATAKSSYTVTATNAGGSTTFALELSSLFERATADRTDDKPGVRQVHVMYVLPADGADDELDKLGKIEGSVRSWNKWLSGQTGGKEIRLDTYGGGRLDVTFLQLKKTDAEMSVAGANVRDKIEYHLLANGFDSPDKVYLVYYGGIGDVCGKSAWPPTKHGKVSAVYKTSGNSTNNCTSLAYAGENDTPRFPEFIAAHEVLHAFGLAPTCALHHSSNGHVSDSPTDLMYSGAQPWAPATLDVNHDDYFGSTSCIDLQNSDFLEPSPAGPQLPPGWPYTTLADLGCSNELTTTLGTGVDTQAMFVNNYAPGGTPTPIDISELVLNSSSAVVRQHRFGPVQYLDGVVLPQLPPAVPVPVKENAVFVVTENNVNGKCLAVLRMSAQPNRFAVH